MRIMQRVLVIEDDGPIRRGLVDALRFERFAVIEATDGPRGLEVALTADCDLVLLDLLLPRRDGLEVLREVRRLRPTLPVIILTSRGDESDRVKGLRLGADDYVVKPFSVAELLARIRAVLRRSPARPRDVATVEFAGGRADFERREICFDDGRRDDLTELEADLLRYLAMHAGRAVDRRELLRCVWRIEAQATRTVDMQIARLRAKLRDDGAQPRVLVTVRGKGYMLAQIPSPPGSGQGGGAGRDESVAIRGPVAPQSRGGKRG